MSVTFMDASAVMIAFNEIGCGRIYAPASGTGWDEVETGIWTIPLSEERSLVYYQDGNRLEIEAFDFCFGVVDGVFVETGVGSPKLVLNLSDGTSVLVPIEEVTA